jgi:hypothetical protein
MKNAIPRSVEQHETEIKDMALDSDNADNHGGDPSRKRRTSVLQLNLLMPNEVGRMADWRRSEVLRF